MVSFHRPKKMVPMVLLLLAALFKTGASVQCYICSWSPQDADLRKDNCTDENFEAGNVPTDYCDNGCETFVQRDPNGALDQWRRSCVSQASRITEDCQPENTVAYKRKRCTCSKDYCNGGQRTIVIVPLVIIFAFVPLAIAFFNRGESSL